MKNIRQLLTDVLEIINKYEKIAKENGQNFNIFEICDIETAETTICRVIYNLLNPKGSHGQSITYLRAFCNIVLGIEFSDEKLLNASVFREFRILNTNRRIDIVLRIDGQLIPIEAKINAPDQKDQCYDYYTFAKDNSQDKDSLKLYYLTLFGNTPSDESAGALTKIIGSNNVRYEEIQCISFREEITKWLETCVSLPETKSLLPIHEILTQFLLTVKKLTNQLEEDVMKEMKDKIEKTPENLKALAEIVKYLESAKEDKIKEVFVEIEKHLHSNFEIKKLEYKYDYKKAKTGRSGIAYALPSSNPNAEKSLLCIEIDERLYVGFCDKNAYTWSKDSWDYVSYNGESTKLSIPNFKFINEAYFELFDKNNFDAFIDNAVKLIEIYIKKCDAQT